MECHIWVWNSVFNLNMSGLEIVQGSMLRNSVILPLIVPLLLELEKIHSFSSFTLCKKDVTI